MDGYEHVRKEKVTSKKRKHYRREEARLPDYLSEHIVSELPGGSRNSTIIEVVAGTTRGSMQAIEQFYRKSGIKAVVRMARKEEQDA